WSDANSAGHQSDIGSRSTRSARKEGLRSAKRAAVIKLIQLRKDAGPSAIQFIILKRPADLVSAAKPLAQVNQPTPLRAERLMPAVGQLRRADRTLISIAGKPGAALMRLAMQNESRPEF